jgi:hypothetical protein
MVVRLLKKLVSGTVGSVQMYRIDVKENMNVFPSKSGRVALALPVLKRQTRLASNRRELGVWSGRRVVGVQWDYATVRAQRDCLWHLASGRLFTSPRLTLTASSRRMEKISALRTGKAVPPRRSRCAAHKDE